MGLTVTNTGDTSNNGTSRACYTYSVYVYISYDGHSSRSITRTYAIEYTNTIITFYDSENFSMSVPMLRKDEYAWLRTRSLMF